MSAFLIEPKIIGLITPEIFDGVTFQHSADIELCDALEMRYDLFEEIGEWKKYASIVRRSFPGKEIIGTIRLEADGGKFFNEFRDKRNILLNELMLLGDWDFVDLEYEQRQFLPQLQSGAKSTHTKIIVSHHNFVSAYSKEQYKRMADIMTKDGADAIKFAVMAHTEEEINELYDFITENKLSTKPLPVMSAFSMGTYGMETRRTTPKLGAPYTYGYFGESAPVSGQISVKNLYHMLKNS